MTFAEISSSTVRDRSRVSGPSSWQFCFASVPSEDLHQRTLRGGVRQCVVLGSTERFEPLEPKLLSKRQQVPVILERGYRSRERTANAHGALLRDTDCLLEWITSNVVNQGEVERDERQYPPIGAGLGHGVVHLPVLVANCRGRRAIQSFSMLMTFHPGEEKKNVNRIETAHRAPISPPGEVLNARRAISGPSRTSPP
jgi:hypothetical protein